MAESEEELKSLLKLKEESEKADLRLNIHKTKIMTSSSITSWHINGETIGIVRDSLHMVSAAIKSKDACSLEEKLWPIYAAY